MTNGDRIRSMDDEKLTEFMEKLMGVCSNCPCNSLCEDEAGLPCYESILKWLEQEAE